VGKFDFSPECLNSVTARQLIIVYIAGAASTATANSHSGQVWHADIQTNRQQSTKATKFAVTAGHSYGFLLTKKRSSSGGV